MFLCLETLFSLFLSLSPQSSFFSTLYCEECQTHSKVEGILVNTYHLDCTINVLLCLPYHTSIHLTIPLCILHIYIFFNVFQSKLQTRAHNLFLFFFSGLYNLSSLTRDQTHSPSTEASNRNHGTPGKSNTLVFRSSFSLPCQVLVSFH